MHALARGGADHLLAELAQQHTFAGDVRMGLRHADDVAPVHLGVKTKQQVGRGQVKEMQGVRLHHLAVMHQAADLVAPSA